MTVYCELMHEYYYSKRDYIAATFWAWMETLARAEESRKRWGIC